MSTDDKQGEAPTDSQFRAAAIVLRCTVKELKQAFARSHVDAPRDVVQALAEKLRSGSPAGGPEIGGGVERSTTPSPAAQPSSTRQTIRRFRVSVKGGYAEVNEHPEGAYCLYSDVASAPSSTGAYAHYEELAAHLYSHSHFHEGEPNPTAELMREGADAIRLLRLGWIVRENSVEFWKKKAAQLSATLPIVWAPTDESMDDFRRGYAGGWNDCNRRWIDGAPSDGGSHE